MIPVQNIYYLLSYAWNRLEESETLNTGIADYHDSLSLFTRVLNNGCYHLLKRGLHGNYDDKQEAYRGIKGKLLISKSIKSNLLGQGLAICEFDEFVNDTLPNKIIKYTLSLLLRSSLDINLKQSCRDLYRRLGGVSLQKISSSDFKRVKLGRNNYHYQFILHVCELILKNLSLEEKGDKYQFSDFSRDHQQMSKLFESFLLNFYRKHLDCIVRREDIHWQAEPILGTTVRLPKMQTDITIESEDRKIIIDAKFYNQALQSYYNKESIRSENLYQIYAYLKNVSQSNQHPANAYCEGILIYPTVKRELQESYLIDGHKITIATINLNQEWRGIEDNLMGIITD